MDSFFVECETIKGKFRNGNIFPSVNICLNFTNLRLNLHERMSTLTSLLVNFEQKTGLTGYFLHLLLFFYSCLKRF